MVVRRRAQRCAVNSLQAEVDGNTILQRVSHQRISNRAITEAASKALPQARHAGLIHPRAPHSHLPSKQPIHRGAEMRIRCECCNDACTLASLPAFGYDVQRKSFADAVSERSRGEEKDAGT